MLILIRPEIPTRIKINLDMPASWPPNIDAIKSNWKKPINPQLMALMMLTIRVIFCSIDKDIIRTSFKIG
jgi:hypothetical protein